MIVVELESWPATRPGALRMPIPSVLPTMTASPKPTPRMRMRPRDVAGAAVTVMANVCRLLRLQRDEHDVNGRTDVSRRMARANRFELDIAALPAVHDRLAVSGVLD